MKFIFYFLLKLFQSQNLKKQAFSFPQTPQIRALINKLTREGFLYGYKSILVESDVNTQQKYLQVYLKYIEDSGVLTGTLHYHTYRVLQQVSYKHLLYLKYFSPVILIQTTRGILNHIEAIKFKLGGRILFICL